MSAWFYTYFDYVALLYLLWVMIRSWRYGPYLELYNLLSAVIVLAFFKGISLFPLFWHSLEYVFTDWLHFSRVAGLFVALLCSVYLLWKIRKAMSGLKKKRARKRLLWTPFGFVSALSWIMVLVVIVRWLPFSFPLVSHSHVGFWVARWLPL